MNTKTPAPGWFTAVAVVALLWNLLGVAAWLFTVLGAAMVTPEMLEAMPEADRAAAEAGLAQLAATPSWVTGAFAVAVFGGLLGSILLLMKKNLAVPVFALSLVALIVQDGYALFVAGDGVGAGSLILPAVVFAFAIFLLWVALKAKKAGWSG